MPQRPILVNNKTYKLNKSKRYDLRLHSSRPKKTLIFTIAYLTKIYHRETEEEKKNPNYPITRRRRECSTNSTKTVTVLIYIIKRNK